MAIFYNMAVQKNNLIFYTQKIRGGTGLFFQSKAGPAVELAPPGAMRVPWRVLCNRAIGPFENCAIEKFTAIVQSKNYELFFESGMLQSCNQAFSNLFLNRL